MGAGQKIKSEETRRKVLEAAQALMAEKGLAALQIRTIAAKAGYSIGSVYKHFADLDTLIIAVNSVTLERIEASMTAALSGEKEPMDRLKALANAYLAFAYDNPDLWRGLFEHHLPHDQEMPQEHRDYNIALLSYIGREIAALAPDLGDEERDARTRTCFAAVHGLVTFSMEGRFVGLSGQRLQAELNYLVERLAG